MASVGEMLDAVRWRLDVLGRSKRELDRRIAPDFDVFTHLDTREPMMSRIIADLLDPRGAHGQGDTFAQAFVRILKRAPRARLEFLGEELRSVSCERVIVTQQSPRRIDIEMLYSGPSAIAIENKIGVREQADQLEDYAEDMRKRYGTHFALVFLTESKREPTSLRASTRAALESSGRFIQITYGAELREWLERCQQLAQAEEPRWFIRALEKHIARHFEIPQEAHDADGF